MISWVKPVNPSHPYLENDLAPSFDPPICVFHLGFSLGLTVLDHSDRRERSRRAVYGVSVQQWQTLITTLPLLAFWRLPSFGAIDDSTALSGRVRSVYSARHGCPALLHGRPGLALAGRAGGLPPALGAHRGAHHVAHRSAGFRGPRTRMARSRLRRRATDVAGPEVKEPSGENRSPRDKVVALAMRTALRHIGDGIQWACLDEESPGTGKRRAGAHSLRHSAARHWLMVGKVPLNVVSAWLGQVTLRIYLPIVGSDYGMEDVP